MSHIDLLASIRTNPGYIYRVPTEELTESLIVEAVRRRHTLIISEHLRRISITSRMALAVFATEEGIIEGSKHQHLRDLASRTFPQLNDLLDALTPELLVYKTNEILDGISTNDATVKERPNLPEFFQNCQEPILTPPSADLDPYATPLSIESRHHH